MTRHLTITGYLCLALLAIGCASRDDQPSAAYVVTTSYLECALRDVLDEPVTCIRLAEPGTCPGHFDVRPSQINAMRQARVLLRLDFQVSLDDRLSSLTKDGLAIASITIDGGMCEPDSYLGACRQITEALVEHGLLDADTAQQRLTAIGERLTSREATWRAEVEGWRDTPVLTSAHQAAFCRWLGLNVVDTFSAMDTAGVGGVDRAIKAGDGAGVRLVVANLPEGRDVADALADRLGASVVVFGNFPLMNEQQPTFDAMLNANAAALREALRQ